MPRNSAEGEDDDDDEPPLNEDDDDDDEIDDLQDGDEEPNTQHLVLAQFDKVILLLFYLDNVLAQQYLLYLFSFRPLCLNLFCWFT